MLERAQRGHIPMTFQHQVPSVANHDTGYLVSTHQHLDSRPTELQKSLELQQREPPT